MINFINLTAHRLNIHTPDGEVVIEPSASQARSSHVYEDVTAIGGIPVTLVSYGEITGLPEPQPDTVYIVSGIVEAASQRDDVYAVGQLIRDDDNRVVGCHGLKQSKHDE